MCILIIRTWKPCNHTRLTANDICMTAMSTPGMQSSDCPNASHIFPSEDAGYPCPACSTAEIQRQQRYNRQRKQLRAHQNNIQRNQEKWMNIKNVVDFIESLPEPALQAASGAERSAQTLGLAERDLARIAPASTCCGAEMERQDSGIGASPTVSVKVDEQRRHSEVEDLRRELVRAFEQKR